MMRTVALCLALLSCRIVSPGQLPTGADAGTPERAAAVCGQLRKLACPEGSPSPKGETCEALYQRVPDALDGRCVLQAQTVADVRDCDVKCGGDTAEGSVF